jgi:iron complex outermembrane receptor protein
MPEITSLSQPSSVTNFTMRLTAGGNTCMAELFACASGKHLLSSTQGEAMTRLRKSIWLITVATELILAGSAHAQRANQNAVADADDAFGTTVGLETTGIYSDGDTRGFSPIDAGNARIEGIYYDPVGYQVLPLRDTTAIRVGMAAKGFPFNAPTGIADYRYRPFPEEYGMTVSYQQGVYEGFLGQTHLRLPLVRDKVGLLGGVVYGKIPSSDVSYNRSMGSGIRGILRFGGFEIAPFYGRGDFFTDRSHTLAVPTGADLPDLPRKRRYLGQAWAKAKWHNIHTGVTMKGRLTDSLSLRAGVFRSSELRTKNFSDIYFITGPGNAAQHRLIADPRRLKRSTSGETILALNLGGGHFEHHLFAGFRARDRLTETGGSDTLDFGAVHFGDLSPEPKPDFDFSSVNVGRVRQSALMVGYIGSIEGVGQLNLGLQKARYRARFRDTQSGAIDRTSANSWLYNATLTVELSRALAAYVGSQRGLEDRGVAPDHAVNRSEQLPATIARQYEGGLRWKFTGGQLVVNAFEITKPYFSYDQAGRFVELGDEIHRGMEASLAGSFGRLTALGGVVAMKRVVSGAAVRAGVIGRLPTGTRGVRGRMDLNYRTDIFGGLTPTATLTYHGRRAVGSRPLAALGGKQLMLPAFATFDLGLRQKFRIGSVTASARLAVENVFDKRAWRVAAADTLFLEESRRVNLFVTADL